MRLLGRTDINEIAIFAFPNLESSHCLIEIRVIWENYRFVPIMSRYTDLSNGITRLQEVISEQCLLLCKRPVCRLVLDRTLIRLSKKECDDLCSGSTQMFHSRHVMVHANNMVFIVQQNMLAYVI